MTEQIPILDHGYIKVIESYGSDEAIIEAARMSTGRGFLGWDDIPCHMHDDRGIVNDCKMCFKGDKRLLKRLWIHKHTSPFEMAGMIIEVQAPIFVFREWHRHRTQSYNEFSARYSELPDLFYIPSIERLMNAKQSNINKQSSEEGFTLKTAQQLHEELEIATKSARVWYDNFLKEGVSREVARLVIPVNQYSKMRASANLLNWTKFLNLRLHKDAQWEIRQYANGLLILLTERFPRTMELFIEEFATEKN